LPNSTAIWTIGYEARLLTIEQIADSVDLFAPHYREARNSYPNAAENWSLTRR